MAENEMVERVARAIKGRIQIDATGLAPAIASAYIVGIEETARAAIEAMREPTEAMCDEGAKDHRWGYGASDAKATWGHMISAALQENSNG